MEWLKFLKDLARRVGRPVYARRLDRVRAIMAASIERSFEREQAPSGFPWPPPARNYGRKLLQRTGLMKRSAIQAALQAQPQGSGIMASLPYPSYAVFQNEGTSHHPQREFFGIGPGEMVQIAEVMAETELSYVINGLET